MIALRDAAKKVLPEIWIIENYCRGIGDFWNARAPSAVLGLRNKIALNAAEQSLNCQGSRPEISMMKNCLGESCDGFFGRSVLPVAEMEPRQMGVLEYFGVSFFTLLI